MSAEQRILSEERLRVKCEGLSDGRALSVSQFANFVESFCLLCGEKPSEDPHAPFAEMEYKLVEGRGEYVVAVKWTRALGVHQASISFTKDQSPLKIEEGFDVFLEDGRGFQSVKFPSSVLQGTKTLAMPLHFNPYKSTCSELGIVCRKVWEIYNSQKT